MFSQLFNRAFPPPREWVAFAYRAHQVAERDALEQILKTSKGHPSVTKTIEHRGSADEIDDAIRKELATADAAAASTGATFREAMRRASEIQAAEIDRLRAVIADFSKDRPRVLVSITTARRNDFRDQPEDRLFGVANDGTIWESGGRGKIDWVRTTELPQAADELEK